MTSARADQTHLTCRLNIPVFTRLSSMAFGKKLFQWRSRGAASDDGVYVTLSGGFSWSHRWLHSALLPVNGGTATSSVHFKTAGNKISARLWGKQEKSGNIGRAEAVVSFEMWVLFTVCERVSDGSNKHATLVERNLLSYWPMSDSYSFHWSFQMSFILPRLLGFSSDWPRSLRNWQCDRLYITVYFLSVLPSI